MIKIEVGQMYELNNGEVHECTHMYGDDPLSVSAYGYGPFVVKGMEYHQDGRVADYGADHELSVKRCVSNRDQELTSPYGDNNPPVSDAPKTWGEMTDVEKGALLLAHHEGKVIEFLYPNRKNAEWDECDDPIWVDCYAYRIKPEPKRETIVKVMYCDGPHPFIADNMSNPTHRITFDTLDGKPVLDSIKMNEI